MPYIELRKNVVTSDDIITTPGELNYAVTRLVEQYRQVSGDCYQTFNDIVGALDNAKDEFRRRVQHPYEDRKRHENGDVYAPLDA